MRTYLTRSPVMSPLATVLAPVGGLVLLAVMLWDLAGNPLPPDSRDCSAYDVAVTQFLPDKIQTPVPPRFSSFSDTAVTYHGNLGLVGGLGRCLDRGGHNTAQGVHLPDALG